MYCGYAIKRRAGFASTSATPAVAPSSRSVQRPVISAVYLVLAVLFLVVIPHNGQYTYAAPVLDSAVADDAQTAPASPAASTFSQPTVLVLGSAGLIGSYLTHQLEQDGFQVLHVYNRSHIDLRQPGSLDEYIGQRHVDFCFFLACEVGGSKYIENNASNIQLEIIEHNVMMYQNVLTFLRTRRIPFLFSSSYLQAQSSSYGAIKRLGEAWIRAQRWGKIVRFWNVYGEERIGPKSHVLQDWTHSCMHRGYIRTLTDGYEQRQFLHARDLGQALVLLMRHYDRIPDPATSPLEAIDISGGNWTPLRSVAEIIQDQARTLGHLIPHPNSASQKKDTCDIMFADKPASFRARLNPNMQTLLYKDLGWVPSVSMEDGIRELLIHASKSAAVGVQREGF